MTLFNPDLYRKALRFAALAHGEQLVPGTRLPYVIHVTEVCAEVIAMLSVESVTEPNLAVCCALLHDTIEDTKTTEAQISAEFGTPVAAGVLALSKNSALPKPEAMKDSLQRIRQQPKEIWCVKLADRIVNLGPPPHYWTPQKIEGYKKEAELIRDTLGEASSYLQARIQEKIAIYPNKK